jgi:superfamily I DNA and/or RNA helicase
LFDISKEFGLEVNIEKTKCTFISCHQTIGQNHYIKVANKYLNKLTIIKYLEIMVKDQNYSPEEIKSRLIVGILATKQFRMFSCSICYLKTNIINIYRTVTVTVILYGCETLFLC